MQREQRSHHGAAAGVARRAQQHPEQQCNVGRVQQDVGAVVLAGIERIEVAVERVGEPGQGMPVGVMEGGEGPGHGVPLQPVLHMPVVADVGVVVGVGEGIVADRVIERESGKHQQAAEREGRFSGRREETFAGRRNLLRRAQTNSRHSSSLGG